MLEDNSQARIFLSSQRGYTETDWFRSCNTFQPGKNFFGSLCMLNDDTLAGGMSFSVVVEDDADVILLPIVGGIKFKNSEDMFAEAGQTIISSTSRNVSFKISNPYENELINFLQLWIKRKPEGPQKTQLIQFDLETSKNEFTEFYSTETYKCSIGKFDGRNEVIYKTSKPGNGIFVFVIEGAFEVQYRLLEPRDGLAIWKTNEIEIEALSNNAIIFLLELESSV